MPTTLGTQEGFGQDYGQAKSLEQKWFQDYGQNLPFEEYVLYYFPLLKGIYHFWRDFGT